LNSFPNNMQGVIIRKSHSCSQKSISFRNILNNKGPKMGPWGTPISKYSLNVS